MPNADNISTNISPTNKGQARYKDQDFIWIGVSKLTIERIPETQSLHKPLLLSMLPLPPNHHGQTAPKHDESQLTRYYTYFFEQSFNDTSSEPTKIDRKTIIDMIANAERLLSRSPGDADRNNELTAVSTFLSNSFKQALFPWATDFNVTSPYSNGTPSSLRNQSEAKNSQLYFNVSCTAFVATTKERLQIYFTVQPGSPASQLFSTTPKESS